MVISLLSLLLISNAVALQRDKSILFSRVVMFTLFISSIMVLNNIFAKAIQKGVGILGGLFNVTTLTQTFNMFVITLSITILIFNSFFPRKVDSFLEKLYFSTKRPEGDLTKERTLSSPKNLFFFLNKGGKQFRIIEYPLIIVFILCGSLFLMSSGDLISIFLAIELQSYGLYILCTLYRNSESATASGLTYFLLGGLSSCFILLGFALLYANLGSTNLDNIYIISNISQIKDMSFVSSVLTSVGSLLEKVGWYQPAFLQMSFIVISVGFLFKISAAPFHFWSPDVYDGIPTIVTTYVAIIAKIAIFALLLELVYFTECYFLDMVSLNNAEITSSLQSQGGWKNVLLLSSLLSLIVGSVLGITQLRIKRLLAYSTISHVGFILLALCVNNAESVQAYIFYILQYSISNLNAFVILITIGYSLYLYVYKSNDEERKEKSKLVDQNYSPIQLISQLKGYFNINSIITLSLGITIFSFVGVPPLIGFFAKQMVLSAALDAGYVFMSLVAILTSVIGAAYYLNIIKQLFFYNHDYEIVSKIEPKSISSSTDIFVDTFFSYIVKTVTLSSSLTNSIAIITLIVASFIFVPTQWFNIVNILSSILFNT